MKAMLFFPPHWQPMMPHLALPALTSYLRAHGVEVIQRDLNIETFDHLLSSRTLRVVINQLRRERKRLQSQPAHDPERKAYVQLVEWSQSQGKEIAERIESAKETVRSSAFYDSDLSLSSFFALQDALVLASIPHFPAQLGLTQYDAAYPTDASQAIRAAVQDRHTNPFRTLFQVNVLPQIRHERPDIVGISVTSAAQIMAAFTLAALIKEAGLPAHIVLGGKMITGWRDQLPAAAPLWELFDSAIVFEGEVSMLRLIEALERGTDLASVPNLMYAHGSHVHVNDRQSPEPFCDLPSPDFEGLPLSQYLAPSLVLPISASRGCYWGRCAFCNVGYGESKQYRERQAALVADEMLTLARTHNTRHFFFADEALSPRMLKSLSATLIARQADLDWTCCARFEPGLTARVLAQMRQAGCRMVLYGLESGSQRVLDRMHKGTRLETARRILREGRDAGIWNHIFFFFGFPGETEQDAQETIQFFLANGDLVHSVSTGTFLLERHAEASLDPGAYGISRLILPGAGSERDLAVYYDYQVNSGIDAARATEIEARFLDSLPEKQAPQYYFHDIWRFLYACHFQGSESLPTMLG